MEKRGADRVVAPTRSTQREVGTENRSGDQIRQTNLDRGWSSAFCRPPQRGRAAARPRLQDRAIVSRAGGRQQVWVDLCELDKRTGFGFDCRMIKSLLVSLFSCALAFALQAQTEPQKSVAPLGKSTPPPS